MKLPPKSGRHLLLPGLIAAVLVGVGVAAVVAANGLVSMTQTELGKAKSARAEAQSRLARATDEEREIQEKLVDYRKLLDRGVIGEEQRLDWIDRIAAIKTARKLFDVKYTIDPQRQADFPGLASKGDVDILASQMKLDMALLHEEDLLRFIGDLRGALSAYVLVKTCTVDRSERQASDRGIAPRLRANCDIDLITIRDPQAKRS
jgi:hypothetical protein